MQMNVLQLSYSVGFVDLLIISEFIKEVALAFTTGTGDLAGNAASKVGIFTPLSPSWLQRFILLGLTHKPVT